MPLAATAAALLALLLAAGPARASHAHWIATSVDTMKESLDASDRDLSPEQLDQHVAQLAALGVSHITVDTPMDRPAVYRQWVSSIRAHGKKVWHRPMDWGYPDPPALNDPSVTPAMYLDRLAQFIGQNPDLFQAGDLFDGDSEADAHAYWRRYPPESWWNAYNPPYTADYSEACQEFNRYLVDLKTVADELLMRHGITDVNTGIRALTTWFADANCLMDSTIASLGGWLTIDGYFGDGSSDPAEVASVIDSALERWHARRPTAKIIMGEYGWSNDCALGGDDALQHAVLDRALPVFASKPYVHGLNYWVGAGGLGYGGCTNILRKDETGSWQPRPGAEAVRRLFTSP